MGATSFELVIETEAGLTTVYESAVADARAEYGSDPYNGTIATTSGVHQHPTLTHPVSPAVASTAGVQRLDLLNKWEDAEAIPLAVADDIIARTVKVNVSLPEGRHRDYDAASAAVRDAAQQHCKDGEHIARLGEPQWNVKLTRSVTVTPGTAHLTYYVTTGKSWEDNSLRALGIDARGYSTKAEARAAAVAATRQATDRLELFVKANRTVNGNPTLLTVKAHPETAKATVEVVLHRTKKGAKRVGWLLYGWAAE